MLRVNSKNIVARLKDFTQGTIKILSSQVVRQIGPMGFQHFTFGPFREHFQIFDSCSFQHGEIETLMEKEVVKMNLIPFMFNRCVMKLSLKST